MHRQLKHIVVSLAAVLSLSLFAGNWTLDTTTKILTSEDGYWSLTNCSVSGKTLTLGKILASAEDGILDFRNATVNDTAINKITIAQSWGASANVKEFYCDALSQVISSLFSGNTILEKFQVGSLSNKGIGSSSFKNCTSLTTLDFGGPITSANTDAFSGCKNLDVDAAELIATSFNTAGNTIFSGCSKLHGKLTLIGFSGIRLGAFSGTGIQELVLESPNFTSFQNKAFNGCTSLTNVTISCANLTTLGATTCPFENCTALEKVTFNLPAVTTVSSNSNGHYFKGCSAIKEVIVRNSPWDETLTRRWFNHHVFYSVPAVAATVDAPKNCTIYALRSDYKPYASAMTGDYEKLYAPKRCYGVYCSGSSRLAYMAQPPDYKSGMFVSVQ